MTDWEDITQTSRVAAMLAVKDRLRAGDTQDALAGMAEVVLSLVRAEEHEFLAMQNQLCANVYWVLLDPTSPECHGLLLDIEDHRDTLQRHATIANGLNAALEKNFDRAKASGLEQARRMSRSKATLPDFSWQEMLTVDVKPKDGCRYAGYQLGGIGR